MDDVDKTDWKRIAERLFNGFFGGRCLFKARYLPDASIDGTHFGVWTIDGYRPDEDRAMFYSVAVDSELKLGECYKSHVENFCDGLYFDGEGRRTPKLEWSSDEELLLKLSALGMAEVNNGDGDHTRKRPRRGAGQRGDGRRDRRGGGRPLQGRPS